MASPTSAADTATTTGTTLVKEAMDLGLRPVEKMGTATGYAGIIEVKGKYQARVYDAARKRQRAVPGLHDSPLHAALALARAKQVLLDNTDEGWSLPSPAKRKSRRPPPTLPIAMAIPLGTASPGVPLVSVQPSGGQLCAAMALLGPAAAMAAM